MFASENHYRLHILNRQTKLTHRINTVNSDFIQQLAHAIRSHAADGQ